MAEIINLRSQRKKKARAAADALAAQNRLTFGRSKADKQREELNRTLSEQKLDGHRLSDKDAPHGDQ